MSRHRPGRSLPDRVAQVRARAGPPLRRLVQTAPPVRSERAFVAEGVEVSRLRPRGRRGARGRVRGRRGPRASATWRAWWRAQPRTGEPGVHARTRGGPSRRRHRDAASGVRDIFPMIDVALEQVVSPTLAVVCVDVRDPGNAGTLLRTCDAAGVDLVVCCGGTVDPFNPKTVRSSAGSIFHAPVAVTAEVGSDAALVARCGAHHLRHRRSRERLQRRRPHRTERICARKRSRRAPRAATPAAGWAPWPSRWPGGRSRSTSAWRARCCASRRCDNGERPGESDRPTWRRTPFNSHHPFSRAGPEAGRTCRPATKSPPFARGLGRDGQSGAKAELEDVVRNDVGGPLGKLRQVPVDRKEATAQSVCFPAGQKDHGVGWEVGRDPLWVRVHPGQPCPAGR